jgi:hypothetical protein
MDPRRPSVAAPAKELDKKAGAATEAARQAMSFWGGREDRLGMLRGNAALEPTHDTLFFI